MIKDELNRIASAKTDIINAIIEKNVEIPVTIKIDGIADYIKSISTSTTSEYTLSSITISSNTEWVSSDNVVITSITADYSGYYKKRVDENGNEYIINDNGETIQTKGNGGGTTSDLCDEYIYVQMYVPSDKDYNIYKGTFFNNTMVSELYFDGNKFTISDKNVKITGNVAPNSTHTIKAKLISDNDSDTINQLSYSQLFVSTNTSSTSDGSAQAKSIKYPYGATNIEAPTFGYNVLETMTIPSTTTSVNLKWARNSLKSITFDGTMSEWENVTVTDAPSTYVVHCSDGDIEI